MQSFDLYKDISQRTGGDIYIGVVGPVRTGKSTFIKRFMDLMVLPNIPDANERQRALDELPQSAAVKTIMTTQPKFIPNEAVEITVQNEAVMRVRMMDCVGYMVDGAMGHTEFDAPRMVRTPWFDSEIPFSEAAEIGTRKVIEDHSTIGIVLTTDGSITEIPREAYVSSEQKVIGELQTMNKPFMIVINSADPQNPATQKLKKELQEKYHAPVMILDVLSVTKEDLESMLQTILYEFPILQAFVEIPGWACALQKDHWIVKNLLDSVLKQVPKLHKMKDYVFLKTALEKLDVVCGEIRCSLFPGEGKACMKLSFDDALFYKVLGEQCGFEIEDDCHLMSTMKELTAAKNDYDKISVALKSANELGYGVVSPRMEELSLEEPEIVKQGNRFGVKLKASAPSLHIIKVNINTEVSPILGTERQSQEMVDYLLSEFENDPAMIWSTDIFGKSLHELVKEGLSNKLNNIPEDAREKMQQTLQRVVNEGDGGMLCILL